ncbi:hypothetical protein BgiMline_001272 [Biomphalaria glabrata]
MINVCMLSKKLILVMCTESTDRFKSLTPVFWRLHSEAKNATTRYKYLQFGVLQVLPPVWSAPSATSSLKCSKCYPSLECSKCYLQFGVLQVLPPVWSAPSVTSSLECSKCYLQFGVLQVLPPVWSAPSVTPSLECSKCYLQFGMLQVLLPVWSAPSATSSLECSKCYLQFGVLQVLPPVWSAPSATSSLECSNWKLDNEMHFSFIKRVSQESSPPRDMLMLDDLLIKQNLDHRIYRDINWLWES